MDTVFVLFILAFVAYGFLNGGKNKKRRSTLLRTRIGRSEASDNSAQTQWKNQDQKTRFQASNSDSNAIKSISAQDAVRLAILGKAGFARTREAFRMAKRGGDELSDSDKSADAVDKNPSRRTDWGARAGPGVLSSRNLLILVAITLALMLLSQISMNFFL